jgi:hypothetical protein
VTGSEEDRRFFPPLIKSAISRNREKFLVEVAEQEQG